MNRLLIIIFLSGIFLFASSETLQMSPPSKSSQIIKKVPKKISLKSTNKNFRSATHPIGDFSFMLQPIR